MPRAAFCFLARRTTQFFRCVTSSASWAARQTSLRRSFASDGEHFPGPDHAFEYSLHLIGIKSASQLGLAVGSRPCQSRTVVSVP
jgi:hypothetical protein